ncbi:MAG: alpha/beta fold hydrolase [Planctomycetaceae bacterium]|nr:alpha/beta fold hydrolase [Planctomycetaceae bacterium]
MSVPTQNIIRLALLFLLAAGCQCFLTQAGVAQVVRQAPSQNDAINARRNAYVRLQDQRAAEERDRMAWENAQRRQMEAMDEAERKRIEAIRNRHSIERRPSSDGYQSPTVLNSELDALRPGSPMELHGDLFTAADGMILSATYYRGTKGKESVPVVLLHGLGGSRSDFDPIVPELLKNGMAVLVPDIRGHGKSSEFIVEEFGEPFFPYFPEIPIREVPENPFAYSWLPDRWADYQLMSNDVEAGRFQKPPTKINAKRYDKYDERDFALMVHDLQVWQNFLINENNQERLNIKKLNLVGTEMGAGLAVHWCRSDQAGSKQTKTMTLISPVVPANAMEAKKGNGTNLGYLNNNAMKNSLHTMIIAGKDNQRARQDAEKVKETLLGKGKVDNEPDINAKYPLFLGDTARQGRDLFEITSLRIERGIPRFINDRLGKLEAAAAEKRNDRTLVWAAIGNWNKKVAPPPERPAARTTSSATSARTQ